MSEVGDQCSVNISLALTLKGKAINMVLGDYRKRRLERIKVRDEGID